MMIRRLAVPLLAIIVLGLGFSSGAWAQAATSEASPAPAETQGVGYATVQNVQGKIVGVDRAKSLVTFEGEGGRKVTLYVRNPDNLKAAKVGEPFAARFYEVVTIRKKKPGENIQSASLSAGIWTTNPLGVPGGARAIQAKVLVTVDAIDLANGTVTIKASDGTTETVKARDPRNLKLLKVGDELVIGLYRGVAISLSKQAGAGAS
jgi:hypothetical protein